MLVAIAINDIFDGRRPEYNISLKSSSFLFYWRYNPLWVLAFAVILLHSVLSLLSFLHPLIPNAWMSSSISSTHLFLGLPLILLPVGFNSYTLLGILFSSIRITCPNQAILLLFINPIMSAFPMSSFSSWFILILHDPSLSCTGPKMFLNIFIAQIPIFINFACRSWNLHRTCCFCLRESLL